MYYSFVFPGGKRRAVTFSYDDGQRADLRLVELFNKYKVKGTFHLNSSVIGEPVFITEEEASSKYEGHEISTHCYTHPFPSLITKDQMVSEVWEDRKTLEKYAGYPVRGMSYPFGDVTKEFVDVAKTCGIEYSRTVASTGEFHIPEDFMYWNPTCHHNDADKYVDEFFNGTVFGRLKLFYVWGHSFEFERENTWDKMEDFLKKISGKDDVWYATNIEIKDYITAARSLKTTADGSVVYNPSALTISLVADNKFGSENSGKDRFVDVGPGCTVLL